MSNGGSRGRSGPADPEIVRAQADVELARESVTKTMLALERQLASTFDWREWVRQRPYLAVAAAFAVGAFLGSGPSFCRRMRR